MTDDEALRNLLGSFRSSAWRLEALAQYTVPAEEATLGAFLRGATHRPHTASFASFLDLLRSLPGSGRTMGRVHASAGPLTPYLRYEIEWSYVAAVEAGEDIRLLHTPSWAESPFGEQPPDFWLVDDASVAVMHDDEVGHWVGADFLTVPADVVPYRRLRDLAVGSAVPLTTYPVGTARRSGGPVRTLRVEGRRGQGWVQGEIGEHEAASTRLDLRGVTGSRSAPSARVHRGHADGDERGPCQPRSPARRPRQTTAHPLRREPGVPLPPHRSVLRTRVAPVSAMRTQLRRMLALDDGFSHIHVAMIPQSRPLRRWTMTSFDVWGDTVSIELRRKEVRLREPEYVRMYASLFEEMWADAAVGPDFIALIRDADHWLASLPQDR